MKNKDELNQLKAVRQDVQKKRNALRKQARDLNRQIQTMFWQAISEAAATGDIAINRSLAKRLVREMELEDDSIQILEDYIRDCEKFAELQKAFAIFYRSQTFGEICDFIQTLTPDQMQHTLAGWRTKKPRITKSEYRQNV